MSTTVAPDIQMPPEAAAAQRLFQIATGHLAASALQVIAKLRVADQLANGLTPGNTPDLGKLIDLEMLMLPGGRERTADEFASLFDRAGFHLTRVVPTESPLSIVEAVRRGTGE